MSPWKARRWTDVRQANLGMGRTLVTLLALFRHGVSARGDQGVRRAAARFEDQIISVAVEVDLNGVVAPSFRN